jgi:ubiquinone biosynthesis protein COQ9
MSAAETIPETDLDAELRADRDAAIEALLPRIAALGWTKAALLRAAELALGDSAAADALFPRGVLSAIEHWSDMADRRMAEAAEAEALSALRTPARIRRLVEIRLDQAAPHRDALRRALGLLALPWNAPVAARMTARTVSAMWYAAGDSSADFSWYTRRASLAAVYGATLAFWLREPEDREATLAFLDRRLAGLARIGRLKGRFARRG